MTCLTSVIIGCELRFSINCKISFLVTLPSFPEPEIASNSCCETPSAAAIFLTNGE